MNAKTKLERAALVVAIGMGAFCACVAVLLIADQYYSARHQLRMYKQELDGWEACRTTEPAYYRANIGAVNACVDGLVQARQNFWAELPKDRLIALYAGAISGGAIAGSTAGWMLMLLLGKLGSGLAKLFKRSTTQQQAQPPLGRGCVEPRRRKLNCRRKQLVEV